MEVVLRHYAVHAFGPIVAASVAGAVISRYHMGDVARVHPADPHAGILRRTARLRAARRASAGSSRVIMIRALFYAERIGRPRAAALRVFSDVQRPALDRRGAGRHRGRLSPHHRRRLRDHLARADGGVGLLDLRPLRAW
jgi:hypothetical protein